MEIDDNVNIERMNETKLFDMISAELIKSEPLIQENKEKDKEKVIIAEPIVEPVMATIVEPVMATIVEPEHSDEEIEKYLQKFTTIKDGLTLLKISTDDVQLAPHDQERIVRLTVALNNASEVINNMYSLMVSMNNIFGAQ